MMDVLLFSRRCLVWGQPPDRAMYIEQEMYFIDIDDLEAILMQKNMSEDGYIWILDPSLF